MAKGLKRASRRLGLFSFLSLTSTMERQCPAILFKFLFYFLFFASANAQDGPPMRIFQWKFSNDGLGFELPSCQNLPIKLQPFDPSNDTHGIPPFYMLGHEVGGTPRLTHIGDNETGLSWTVDHPVGTQLMLNVVDAQGSSGGIPPSLFTVVNGLTTNCIQSGNDTSFTVTSNITMDAELNACAPWGLRIKGGAKPYNLTFAQLNSPNITNLTMAANADGYTYIQRGNPGQKFLVSVSDFTGRWAFGSPIIMPVGSSTECVGLVSSSGNATELDQAQKEAEDAAARHKSNRKTAVIAGILVPVLALLIGGGIALFIWRRRHRMAKEISMGPLDTTPKPFIDEGQVLSINSFLGTHSNTSPRTPKTPPGPPGLVGHTVQSSVASSEPFDPYHTTEHSSTRPNSSSSSSGRPGFNGFPTSSVRRPNGKAAEATMLRTVRSDLSTPSTSQPGPSLPPNTTLIPSPDGDGEYIIQHRDGGGVVRELPPPYADRSLARQDS